MESDLVTERGWIEGRTPEGSAFAPSCDLKPSGATVLQSRNAGLRKGTSGCRAGLTLHGGL
jgi:hypothetical protein